MQCMRPILLTDHLVIIFCPKIKPTSVQTQLNSIYHTEMHPSNRLRSASGSQLVFKTFWGWYILFKSIKTQLKLLKINKVVKVITCSNICVWRFCRQLLQILFTVSASLSLSKAILHGMYRHIIPDKIEYCKFLPHQEVHWLMLWGFANHLQCMEW